MKKKKLDTVTEKGTHIVIAPVVSKSFMKKNEQLTNRKELYLRRSIQDYYIKFCESKISQEDLEKHLSGISGFIKTVTLEVDFKKGEWDDCEEKSINESRVGEYVIVYKIL